MNEIAENGGGRDFRSSDITIQNQIIEHLEAQLKDLELGDHIVSGCEITANDVTSGFVFINDKIRYFAAHNDTGGIPTPFNCSLQTVTVQRDYLDDVTRDAIYEYNLIPDVGGSFDLRTLPNQREAILSNMLPYVKGNYTDGEIDSSTVPVGSIYIGRNGGVKINGTGAIDSFTGVNTNISFLDALNIGGIAFSILNGIASKGTIYTEDSLVAENDIEAAGDVETTGGKFIGDNAPKLSLKIPFAGTSFSKNLGSMNTGLSVSRPSTGLYEIVGTGFDTDMVLTAGINTPGVGYNISAYCVSSTKIEVRTSNNSGALENTSFSIDAKW